MTSGLGLLVLYGFRPAVARIKHRYARRMRQRKHSHAALHLYVNLFEGHVGRDTQNAGAVVVTLEHSDAPGVKGTARAQIKTQSLFPTVFSINFPVIYLSLCRFDFDNMPSSRHVLKCNGTR